MKKKLLPITLLAMLGLVACGPTAPSEVPPTSETPTTTVPEKIITVKIANKEALQKPWVAFGETRAIEATFSEQLNATAEIANGNLVITSSNTNVISVMGKVLTPIGAGKATIKAEYKGKSSDTVEITISEPEKAPAFKAATLAEFKSASEKPTTAYLLKGKIAALGKDLSKPDDAIYKYGNMFISALDAAADEKPMQLYGTAAESSALKYDFGKKEYSFENPQSADKNTFTKKLAKDDIVDVVAIRADFFENIQGTGVIRGVNNVAIPTYKTSVADIAELKAFEVQNTYAAQVSGVIASIDDAAKGILTLKNPDGTETIKVNGLTATNTALGFAEDGAIKFTNPNDFGTNASTKDLKVGDSITLAAGITRNGDANEISGYKLDLKPALNFTSKSVKVGVGKTTVAKVSLENASGEILYEVEDPTIAELAINKYSGQVRGVKVGKTKIKATCGNLTAETEIEVYNAKAEPEIAVKTIKEIKEAAFDKDAKEAYKATVTIKDFGKGPNEYGEMNVTDETGEVLAVNGSTTKQSALSWDDYNGKYNYRNAKDFLKNDKTKELAAGDTLIIVAIRADYNSNIKVNTIIKEIFKAERPEEPKAPVVPDLANCTKIADYDLSNIKGEWPNIYFDEDITSEFTNGVTENGVDFASVKNLGTLVTEKDGTQKIKGVERAQVGQGPKVAGLKLGWKEEYQGHVKFTLPEGKTYNRVDITLRGWENQNKQTIENTFKLNINGFEYQPEYTFGQAYVLSIGAENLNILDMTCLAGRSIITNMVLYTAK